MVLPNLVKFYFFVIFTYSKNFISPAQVVKFGSLGSLFEGDLFILVSPNFVKFNLFFMFAYPENIISPAKAVKV